MRLKISKNNPYIVVAPIKQNKKSNIRKILIIYTIGLLATLYLGFGLYRSLSPDPTHFSYAVNINNLLMDLYLNHPAESITLFSEFPNNVKRSENNIIHNNQDLPSNVEFYTLSQSGHTSISTLLQSTKELLAIPTQKQILSIKLKLLFNLKANSQNIIINNTTVYNNILGPNYKQTLNNTKILLKQSSKTFATDKYNNTLTPYVSRLYSSAFHTLRLLTFPNTQITTLATIKIPSPIQKEYTENLPPFKTKIIQQGQPGKIKLRLSIIQSLINNTTIAKLINIQVLNHIRPVTTIIEIGKAANYRQIIVDNKQIRYYRKLNVWATSYDSNCTGCNSITATGRKLQYGIIAVDPQVIPLHSCLYVPGYGYGQAEDTGGAIKGNKIDLAFEDVHYGWWSARYTDIYIIDCKDAELPWNK